MPAEYLPIVHLDDLLRESCTHGDRYGSVDADIAGPLRLTQLGAALTEVAPGKSCCPFHVHHAEDEMFVILEGEGAYRFGDASYEVRAGHVLGAPRGGPEYAHKLTNTGQGPLRYFSISSKADIEVCEYPDSGKFLVSSRGAGKLRYIGREANALDYFDGEEDA
jgi:uncharacterized cupin superfamily protein